MPGAGVVHVELTAPPERLALGTVPVCRMLVTYRGVPVAYDELANPGGGIDDVTLRRLLLGDLPEAAARSAAAATALAARMGAPDRPAPPLAVSVVVCTRRRPDTLADLLAALTRLAPPPAEVVVVDNDPGDQSCEAAVRGCGFRYVREDRTGLNRARAAGLAAARGDVVAFVDDDCVPPPGWLGRLPEQFGDPLVGAVTGPAFAWALATPAQARFEREDGFRRGLDPRRHDWSLLPPVRATAAGAGANMAFRRTALGALADPFPRELDAGTETQSGGDMWALAGVLDGGWRIQYDPGTWVWHQHRPGTDAMHRALWGYGVGLGSTLVKLALERGELAAPGAWAWLAGYYARGSAMRAAGRADAVRQRLGWDYLRGGLEAPARYARARRAAAAGAVSALPRAPASAGAVAPAAAPLLPVAGGAAAAPQLSVVVPTRGRPHAVAELVAALAAQRGAPVFELVLVDDAGDAAPPAATFPVRVLRAGGRGAAAARNLGARAASAPLLLFLDDDVVPAPDCLAAHAAAHDGSPALVVGACPPAPPRATWAEDVAAWWWADHFAERAELAAPTFKEVLTGNLSVPRAAFTGVGGLSEDFGDRRREDWELGLRAAAAGLPVVLADDAVAIHRFRLDAARHVASGYAEGRGDALLLARHPGAAAALPLAGGYGRWSVLRHPVRWALAALLGRPPARAAGVAVLGGLERVRARRSWARLLGVLRAAAYRDGLRAEGLRRYPRADGPVARIDLAGSGPLPAPGAVLGTVRVTGADGVVRELRHPELRWGGALARHIADATPTHALPPAGATATGDGRGAAGATATGDGREAAGVPVLRWDPRGRWAAVERALHASSSDHVAVLLPGAAAPAAWLADAAAAVAGARVAAVHGGLARFGTRTAPRLRLYGRRQVAPAARAPSAPPDAVVLDRAAVRALGGFAAAYDAAPPRVALLDLLDRAMDAGFVVGALDRGAGAHPRDAWRDEWRAEHARGFLAGARGWHGRLAVGAALDVAAVLQPRAHGRRWRLVGGLARVAGALAAAVHGLRSAR